MKKTFLIIIALISTITVAAQNTTISGHISADNVGGAYASISQVVGSNVVPVDSARINAKGNFDAKVKVDKPALFLVKILGMEKNMIHLMLEPEDKVTIDLRYDANTDYLVVVDAQGSRSMQLYKQFNNILYKYALRIDTMNAEYGQPTTSEERKRQIGMEFQQLQTMQNVEVRQLLSHNTDVLMSAFLVTYFDSDIETYVDLFESINNGLKPKYADNQFVQYVDSRVKSSLVPGRMAPEIAMKDPDGHIRKLSDLRGNIVMIDFWASWCRPCRMENPNVVKLYQKYHSKGFEIYSVSLDKNKVDWLRAIDQDNLVWPNHVSDLNGWTSSGGAAYGITSVPSTVLVDREGRIIARNLRGVDLANKLREIFGE